MLGLTQRQLQVARLIADGHTNSEISIHLGITERTVRYHSDQVRMKLGVPRRRIGEKLRQLGLAS